MHHTSIQHTPKRQDKKESVIDFACNTPLHISEIIKKNNNIDPNPNMCTPQQIYQDSWEKS